MKNIITLFFCIFFSTSAFAVSLSVVSDFNTYVQVYDSLGAIIIGDFVRADRSPKVDTVLTTLDRIRWLGPDKKVYEYHFNPTQVAQRNLFQLYSDNTFEIGTIQSNGITTLIEKLQADNYLLYQ